MSLPKKITISCSKCGTPKEVTVFESVNTDYSPDIANQIISGDLFITKCPKCGFVSRLMYDLLYHDIQRHAMIWLLRDNTTNYEQKLSEARKTPQLGVYKTTRIVTDMNDLREKVACLEHNRDDRIIELCKAFAASNFLSAYPDLDFRNAFYTVADKEYIFIYDTNGKEYTAEFNNKTYNYLYDLYFSSPLVAQFESHFPIIDLDWAESVLQSLFKAEAEKKNIAPTSNISSQNDIDNNDVLLCPYCNEELPPDSTFCQFCGVKIEAPTFTPHIDPVQVPPQNPNPSDKKRKKVKHCSRCGGMIDAKTKQCAACGKKYFWHKIFNKKNLLPIILSSVLLVSVICNISLASELNLYEEIYQEQFSQLWFYEEHVVWVPDDGTNKFHKYGCSKFYQDDGYYAFNTEYAEYLGYKPCAYCIGN